MTSRDFCYWLQGALEVFAPETLTKEQVKIISNHLNLVFKHEIDPIIDGGDPKKKEELGKIHNAGKTMPSTFLGDYEDGLVRC